MSNFTDKIKQISPAEKKMLKNMFKASFVMEHSYNYERQQGLGFSLGMWPAIREIYDNKEDQGDALERHLAVFNATPHIETLIMGIAAAMEKEASINPDFDKSSINAVKVALMGPLSGIGDSIFWGSLRVVAAGIGLSLCQAGNPLGALVFLLVYNIPHLIIKYYCTFAGYAFGTDFVIQDYIDQMFPMLLPLLYTLLMFYLLQVKKMKATTLLLVSIVISFALVVCGLI